MNVKEVLKDNNFYFKKKYGQNFLKDINILKKIASLGNFNGKTLCIEIGVGAGALTKEISSLSDYVIGYEIDDDLKEPLNEILGDYKNVKIIFDDFLKRNIKKDLNEYNFDNLVVIANLPYYITTPIIEKIINDNIDVSQMVLMVQNEVADRFSAKCGSKSYNSLSVFLNYYFDIKKEFVVSKNAFIPKPNVDSAIVVFSKKEKPISIKDETFFFKLVRDSFKQKRKTLKNNLTGYDLNKLEEILSSIGKNLSVRAENITIEEFALIANEYK